VNDRRPLAAAGLERNRLIGRFRARSEREEHSQNCTHELHEVLSVLSTIGTRRALTLAPATPGIAAVPSPLVDEWEIVSADAHNI